MEFFRTSRIRPRSTMCYVYSNPAFHDVIDTDATSQELVVLTS